MGAFQEAAYQHATLPALASALDHSACRYLTQFPGADDEIVRGSAPPETTKVAITGVAGWTNSAILALTGTDLDAKAALVERFVQRYAEATRGLDAIAVERIGQAQHDPDTQNAGTELLRITVQGTQQAAGRAFSSRVVELTLSGYPGLYALGPLQPGSAFGAYWPALLDQRTLHHTVHHHDSHGPSPRRHDGDHRPRQPGRHRWRGDATGRAGAPAIGACTADGRTHRRPTR